MKKSAHFITIKVYFLAEDYAKLYIMEMVKLHGATFSVISDRGPYQILKLNGKVAYDMDLPNELSPIHSVFHVSMLKKCTGDLASIIPLEGLGVDKSLSYEEVPLEILDRLVIRLKTKEIASVKVLWRNHLVEDGTLEAEANMKSRYPHLFPSTPILP
ncbi:hypothetical protein MTR67_026177 [Solanum verrucosum]|uniref:Tf2-1-like SH3-like domain-containing protein n=1 Tax=Solanum verrucosum TaxID=315347 RepID=A0AAF0R2G7_SOLVR|nr:hypothetical protein MTR67_026177 [Solanum verrucosum]